TSAHHNNGEPDRHRGRGEPDNGRRDPSVEQAVGRVVLQLLGACSSLFVCKGTNGEDTDDRLPVVGVHRHHYLTAAGGHQSSVGELADRRIIHVPLTHSLHSRAV
ncbi:unnamed protein product, partial [Musa acuminata var. zebrina]